MEDNSKQIEELKELVRQNIALAEESKEILHSMRRGARWGRIGRWGWWALIFVVSGVGYYYYVQPYVEKIEHAYTSVQSGAQRAADWQTQMNDFFQNLFSRNN